MIDNRYAGFILILGVTVKIFSYVRFVLRDLWSTFIAWWTSNWLMKYGPFFSHVKLKTSSISDLINYEIQYKYPYDISKKDLADMSLNACASTNTLEHNSIESLHAIFTELKRVVEEAGII